VDEEPRAPRRPRCPLCSGSEFQHERGKIDSQWGMTAHKVDMLVCRTCGHVLLFYEGNTIFDFD
jgi:uncharacterized protein